MSRTAPTILTRRDASPRQQVETALRGGHGPRVPFTIYECMIPQCASERAMRNRGLCIVKRDVRVFNIHHPNVQTTQEAWWENGKKFTRTFYKTPVGTLSTLEESAGFTVWRHEKMFKSPEDYKALHFFLSDEQYEANYAAFAQAQDQFGDDAIFRAGFGLEPLQALISGDLIDMQDFCVEWMDHRDEVLKLYDVLVEKRRSLYPIVAQSPALHANYGGNVTVEIIGLDTFRDFYLQHYNEAAAVMHKHGKLIGSHFDANCRLLASDIASTDLDYVEAFTPAPDTDMTLAEAREAWRNKVLWLNFPSSLHLKPDEEVTARTVELLEQIPSVDGLIMGVTEDMPEFRWQHSCTAIIDGLDQHAGNHPQLYA